MREQLSDYSDDDTAEARRRETSSAGLETQQLTWPADPGTTVAPTKPGALGVALVAIGIVLFLGRMISLPIDVTSGMILLTIASVFYFFGFWRRIYGLIIPANMLAGLSLGIPFAELSDGVSVLWGLALGFLLTYVLGLSMFRKRSQWPIIPAVILFAVGLIVLISNLPSMLAVGMVWMPLLLIAAGIYLGWMRRMPRS